MFCFIRFRDFLAWRNSSVGPG